MVKRGPYFTILSICATLQSRRNLACNVGISGAVLYGAYTCPYTIIATVIIVRRNTHSPADVSALESEPAECVDLYTVGVV